jgi:hypothetical protein
MASYTESGNVQKVQKIPLSARNKPPDISIINPNRPNTPLSSPSALSYTDASQRTPTQTLGIRKRPDETDSDERPPKNHTFVTPVKLATRRMSAPPYIAPLMLTPTVHGPDQEMQDPFEEQDAGLEEEECYIDCLTRTQALLNELHEVLNTARKEHFLNSILENQEVNENLAKLKSLSPMHPTHTSPVMKGITDLQDLIHQLAERVQKVEEATTRRPADKSINSSVNAPVSNATTASYAPSTPPPQVYKHANAGAPQIPLKQKPTHSTAQATKAPLNPNSSHHPSRLIAQFTPTGIPEGMRPDPSAIVSKVNAALTAHHPGKHLKVVATNFNTQGNLILSTRADQTASDLHTCHGIILPILAQINNNSKIELHEDKKWFKIQIDAVNTSAISIGNEKVPNTPNMVHAELLSCNPQYAQLGSSLVSKPRWLRTEEELWTTPRSSLVFATTDEGAARLILNHKSLAAFSRHCSVRAFQDRPPVLQCRKCWKLNHLTHQCKNDQHCRLCGGPHPESAHPSDPSGCSRCADALERDDTMDTTAEGRCPHGMRCSNCIGKPDVDHNHPADARRCPARLELYGTA